MSGLRGAGLGQTENRSDLGGTKGLLAIERCGAGEDALLVEPPNVVVTTVEGLTESAVVAGV
jgi:hypothetical protein